MKRVTKKPSGFALIAVVLTILGTSLVAAPLFISARWLKDKEGIGHTQVKVKRVAIVISSTNITGIGKSQRHYEQDVASLPTDLDDLVTAPGGAPACTYSVGTELMTGWCGPYWTPTFNGEEPFIDSWGNELIYDSGGRRVYSKGPNGADNNGAGDDIVQTF